MTKDTKFARITCCRKFINGCMMFQVKLLFQTKVIYRKHIFSLDSHKYCIKDTNYFLKKLRFLPNLPDNIILCIVNVVGLYPNIPYDKGLSALPRRLDLR